MNFISYITQKINNLRKPNKVSLALFLGLLVSPLTHAANIIFDGDGVLFDTKKFQAAKEIGLLKLMSLGKNPTPLFMEFLDSVEPRTEQTPLAYDANGNLLPQLMCDWMTGAKTPAQILNQINVALEDNDLLTVKEKSVLKGMNEFIFGDPQCYAKTKKILRDGKKFVKRCKKKGHKVYILSNWDRPSFQELEKEFSKFLKLFDGVVISGDVGMLKPDPAIYSAIIEKYNLDPVETVFFDDRPENVKAAQEQGLYGILCDKDNFRNARREFLAWEGQHDEQQIV